MSVSGAHMVLYSADADADRAFLRDVLGFSHVDAGDGWLIFALPPAELAVHPAADNGRQELFFMTEDIDAFRRAMAEREVTCGEVTDEGWGLLSRLNLPGGGEVGVYQPRHATPG